MNTELAKKYNIHIINGKRYYEFDMTQKVFALDETVPYLFRYQDIEINSSSWNRMTLQILKIIDDKNPKTEEELLGLKFDRIGPVIFSKEKKTNHSLFRGLYLRTNSTSSRAMMIIQGLLEFYGIPLEECFFLIRKHFKVEPKEVREAIINETKKSYSNYLALNGVDTEKIPAIITFIDKMSKALLRNSSDVLKDTKLSSDDLFLFDDYISLFGVKKQMLSNMIRKKYTKSSKEYKAVEKHVNNLIEFYKNRGFYEHLTSEPANERLIEVIGEEIDSLFDSLSSTVIVADKLYSRIGLKYPGVFSENDYYNNPKSIFLLAKTFYRKKYMFADPFYISKTKDANISYTNDDIITNYAYSLEVIKVDKLNKYADEMHLKRISNYLALFDALSFDYVQVDESTLVLKARLELSDDTIEKINNQLSNHIDSFGVIDSENYKGYDLLPLLDYEWNKYLLLGVCRSYLKEYIEITYLTNRFINVKYTLNTREKS